MLFLPSPSKIHATSLRIFSPDDTDPFIHSFSKHLLRNNVQELSQMLGYSTQYNKVATFYDMWSSWGTESP